MGTYRDKIPALDVLRGIAVLLVVLSHLPESFHGPKVLFLRLFFQIGHLGVELFFVLSGFLITRILLDYASNGYSLKTFWIRRAVRIFPIYYLTIAACLFLLEGTPIVWPLLYATNIHSLSGGNNGALAHTWSLSLEEQFYLVWPILVFALPLRWFKVTAVVLIPVTAFAALGICYRYTQTSHGLLLNAPGLHMLGLFAGALIAVNEKQLRRFPRTCCLCGLMIVAAGLTLLIKRYGLGPHWSSGWTRLIGMVALSTGTVVSLVCAWLICPKPYGNIAGRLSWPLAQLGLISYGVYLYHYPIFEAFGVGHRLPWNATTALVSLSAVTSTLLVSIGSFWFIEQPLLRLRPQVKKVNPNPPPIGALPMLGHQHSQQKAKAA